MGSCYAVELKMKSKDERVTVAAMQKFIRENPVNADFSLEKYAAEGVGTETLDDLVRIFLAGWKSQPVRKEDEGGGFTAYSNGFTASYGWERVMIDMFFAVGETLCDGSELNIDCDDGVDQVVVEDGSVTQLR